ncbi:hypothetical protein [Xanthomonas massiliensis]|uniref:hypothetical protein n=1 Tax=Xanthomonas massiliensis TaxID=1720302 RepID=UPI000B164EC4|nr:hypothetical protein [Xanthomonas massiliensis]
MTTIPFRLPPPPDACTWEDAIASGLGIYAAGKLPPGVEERDFDDTCDKPAEVIDFVARKRLQPGAPP